MAAHVDGIDLGIEGIEGAEEIGAGGFAVVYRARQPAFGRTVAVKVMSVSGLDEHNRLRFERERKAMGSLSDHPGIVTVYDAGFTRDNRPYLVMAYLPRGSLAERVERDGVLSWEEASRVAVRLAGALEVAHQAGVIHRDIKPGNILVSDYDEPMLADFGIARIQGGQETRSGVITASIPHAAPEVLDGHRPTEAADIYSLGSTVYALIAGSPAFVRDTDESIMPLIVRINTEAVPSLTDRGVPQPISAVLERSMAKDPTHRQGSAVEFGEEMRRAQQQVGIAPTEMVHGSERPPQPSSDETQVVDVPSTRTDEPDSGEVTPPTPTPGPKPLVRWLVPAVLVIVVGAVIAFLALRDGDSTVVAGPEATTVPETPEGTTPPPETPPPETPPPETPPPEGPGVVTEPTFLSLLTAADGAAGDVFGRHTATDGTTLVVGARLAANDEGVKAGQTYVFEREGDGWTERGHLSASDPGEGDEFGRPVAVDGDRLLVGARFDDTVAGEDAGSVYFFSPDAGSEAGWTESAKLLAPDAEAEDGFAISMALERDTLVVGAAVEDHDGLTDAGAVYVFRDQGGTWVEEAKLTASDGAIRDRFGASVAISGDTLAVGARSRDTSGGSDAGAVYVFARNGSAWTETDLITLDPGAEGDQLGWRVELDGDTMIATAPFEDVDGVTDAGAAYVYTSSGGSWEQRARLTAPEPQEGSQFGVSAALAGSRVLIGDEFADHAGPVDSGAVHGYARDESGGWAFEFTIVSPDPGEDDHFGASVIVAGDQAIIGAQRDDTELGENSGSLSVFALPPPG